MSLTLKERAQLAAEARHALRLYARERQKLLDGESWLVPPTVLGICKNMDTGAPQACRGKNLFRSTALKLAMYWE